MVLFSVTMFFGMVRSNFVREYSLESESFINARFQNLQMLDIEDAPYNVGVFGEKNKYFCSGTLISLQWVITAAHCMFFLDGTQSEDDTSILIVAGVTSLNETSKSNLLRRSAFHFSANLKQVIGSASIERSSKLVVCYLYNFEVAFQHDLALVKVETPFEMSIKIQPVPLPSTAMTRNVTACSSTGFGKILNFVNSNKDYKLKEQYYTMTKDCMCFDLIKPRELLHQNTWMCATSINFVGLCSGDNGAPLMCEKMLRGVSTNVFYYEEIKTCAKFPTDSDWTRKNDCGNSNNVNIFTDLCLYSVWINSFVKSYPIIDPKTCLIQFSWSPSKSQK